VTVTLDQDSKVEELRALLVGHSIAKVADDRLELDDGTILTIIPNEGGCSCGAGDYELTELNGCENVVTDVRTETEEIPDPAYPGDDETGMTVYRIYVFAVEERVNLMAVTGDDGNGYYGTGYEIQVTRP
jgi:hypothetical protein